jgi:hypothetical protein
LVNNPEGDDGDSAYDFTDKENKFDSNATNSS